MLVKVTGSVEMAVDLNGKISMKFLLCTNKEREREKVREFDDVAMAMATATNEHT